MRVGWLVLLAACGSASPPPVVRTGPVVVAPPARPAAPSRVAWTQLHGPVRSISLTGGGDANYLMVQPLVDSEVGQPFDRARLRGKLDQAMAAETLANLEVNGEQQADGVKLEIVMTEQPQVIAISVHDSLGQVEPVPEALAPMVGHPLAPAAVATALIAARDAARTDGRAAYDASWATTKQAGGVQLVLRIDPGEALRIGTVAFKGNTVPAAALGKLLGPELAVGTAWNSDLLHQRAFLINEYYLDHGYVNVSVEVSAPPVHNPAPLVVTIVEGKQFRYGKMVLADAPPELAPIMQPLLRFKPGAVFNRREVAALIGKLNDVLARAGKTKAVVVPESVVDSKHSTIALTFRVVP